MRKICHSYDHTAFLSDRSRLLRMECTGEMVMHSFHAIDHLMVLVKDWQKSD